MWLQQSHKKEDICMQSGKNFHVRFLNHTDDDLYEGYSRLSSKFSGYLNLSGLGTFHLFLQIYSTSFFTWFVLRLTIMNCFNWPPCLWLPLVQLNGISGKKDNPLPLWRSVEGSCVLWTLKLFPNVLSIQLSLLPHFQGEGGLTIPLVLLLAPGCCTNPCYFFFFFINVYLCLLPIFLKILYLNLI